MTSRQENSSAADAVTARGRAAFPHFEMRWVDRVPSTQDIVVAAAREGAYEGFCCVASEQTAGRGRLGRRWFAPPGAALLASVLLRPRTEGLARVTLAAGLAVCEALGEAAGVRAQLRWPNDVMVDDRKLAGILAEAETRAAAPRGPATNVAANRWRREGDPKAAAGARPSATVLLPAVVVGVGVNLRIDAFPAGAAGISLHHIVERVPAREEVLAALLPALASRVRDLERGGLAALRDDLRSRSTLLGHRVRAQGPDGPLTGVAVDIADDGALVVDGPDGPVPVIAGKVRPIEAR